MILRKVAAPELVGCIAKKLEKIASASSNVKLGEDLFAHKILRLAPFPAVQFLHWDDWEKDPLNNRSWQWRLNWLSFLSYLMSYHQTSKDDKVLSFAGEAIQSWLDIYLNTDTSYPFEFIWHDHATALRAEQLVFFIYYCREHAAEWAEQQDNFLKYVEQALAVHAQWLAKDSFYSEHTNHGLEQARVLLLLGTVFDGEKAYEWQQIAIRRITSELNFAFTRDGVHVENSPAYHIFVFKVFIGIIKDYPANVLGGLADKFEQFSAKALSFITHILRPDGSLPPIGDTEQLPTSDAYRNMFGHTIEYKNFLYALTQGKKGSKPSALNKVYAHSGYAVFRDSWPAADCFQQAFHVIMKMGCLSRYHHQQDEGHISVYGWGEDWLIDSGLYSYINTDPIRKYMRGRAGHNVPLINGTSYSKEFEHRLNNWQVVDCSESEVNPSITLKLQVLEPAIQIRKLDFLAESKRLNIADSFEFSDEQLHDITLQWHIPVDKSISVRDKEVSIVSTSGHQCILTFQNEQPDEIHLLKGRRNDRVYSCISYKANLLEDSQVIRVVFKNRHALNVVSAFDFLALRSAPDSLAPSVHEVHSNGKSFKIDLPDFKTDYIQKTIANLAKPYESEMLEAMSIGLNPMDLVLDIGANIGNHTLYLACILGCQVRAYEPNERLHQPLNNSVKLNGITELVQVLPYGVGKTPSKAKLSGLNESNLGAQSLELLSNDSIGIDVVRLDDQIFETPVAAIKIDVEGMELAVLEGAESLIQKDQPLLVVESVDVAHYDALQNFIKKNNYVYCSSFNGTPTHFFIHQDKIAGSPWIDLFFAKGREFYQMRHYHKKLKKTLQQLNKIK
ncbi:FkbM family methyltransferase [Halomonas sp. AOP43-A1-21]